MKILEQTPIRMILRQSRNWGAMVLATCVILILIYGLVPLAQANNPSYVLFEIPFYIGSLYLFIKASVECTYSFDKSSERMTLKWQWLGKTKVISDSLHKISSVRVFKVYGYRRGDYYRINLLMASGKAIEIYSYPAWSQNIPYPKWTHNLTDAAIPKTISEFLQIPLDKVD